MRQGLKFTITRVGGGAKPKGRVAQAKMVFLHRQQRRSFDTEKCRDGAGCASCYRSFLNCAEIRYEQCHAHRMCPGLVPKIEMSRVQEKVVTDTGVGVGGAKPINFQPGNQNAS